MSDDICERLVRFSKHKQCMSTDLEVEAAAEITRLREENEMLKKSLKSILIGSFPGGPVDVENRCRFADPVWEVKARFAIRDGGRHD